MSGAGVPTTRNNLEAPFDVDAQKAREARNAIIARTAQAAVAVGGSYGTLSEIAFALAFGVPVVGLGTWEVRREGHPPAPIVYAATPEEAVARALVLARRKRSQE